MAEPSYVKGASTPAIVERTLGEALSVAVTKWPNAEALVSCHQNIRWTWAELATRADAVATGLLKLGLVPGDRVGIWAPNCAEWTLTQLATARIGLVLVNINPAYRTWELEYVLNLVGVKALVCAEQFKSSDYLEMVESLAPELRASAPGDLTSSRLPALRSAIKLTARERSGWLPFESLTKETDGNLLVKAALNLRPEDPINVQFTSGTTGKPKGATLSHRNILNNATLVGGTMGLRAGDRLCIPVPLYHCFGMVMGNLACIAHGATMVYPAASFDALSVLKAVEQEKCTALYGVPTMFIAELEHGEFSKFDLGSLRTGIMAGSPCPVEVMRKVIDKMHMSDVGIAYGMTETSPVSFQTSLDAPLSRRVSTVGQIQPHLEAKVVDAKGDILPRGEPGELCARGYSVMIGYWGDRERTREAIDDDNWMHTGDLATIDAEGYCNIVGRIKDMVIRGGENIYPKEVEDFLFGHPKIEMAQVVGVPDAKYGEELCAWVKLRAGQTATAEEITAYCKGQIAHYKVPRYVRFVDAFPMTVTGKVQKFEIRAAMIKELGIAEVETA